MTERIIFEGITCDDCFDDLVNLFLSYHIQNYQFLLKIAIVLL